MFSSVEGAKSLQEQTKEALGLLKDESGVSIMDSKIIESILVSPEREITVKLHLNKNYRKAKALITTHLQA
jgi:Mrp family chromosome partitioning ATPase